MTQKRGESIIVKSYGGEEAGGRRGVGKMGVNLSYLNHLATELEQ